MRSPGLLEPSLRVLHTTWFFARQQPPGRLYKPALARSWPWASSPRPKLSGCRARCATAGGRIRSDSPAPVHRPGFTQRCPQIALRRRGAPGRAPTARLARCRSRSPTTGSSAMPQGWLRWTWPHTGGTTVRVLRSSLQPEHASQPPCRRPDRALPPNLAVARLGASLADLAPAACGGSGWRPPPGLSRSSTPSASPSPAGLHLLRPAGPASAAHGLACLIGRLRTDDRLRRTAGEVTDSPEGTFDKRRLCRHLGIKPVQPAVPYLRWQAEPDVPPDGGGLASLQPVHYNQNQWLSLPRPNFLKQPGGDSP